MRNGLALRICDYIFVLRPLELIPAWSYYLIGAGEAFPEGRHPQVLLPSPRTLICLTAILITAHLLGQIFDRESKTKNLKCPFLSEGIFGVKTLLVLALCSYIVASLLFRRLDEMQRIPILWVLILSLFYSLPPVRLGARPFFDLVANAVGYGGIAFILGYSLVSENFGDGVRLSLPYILLAGATFLHTTVLDVEGNREAGKISTSVLIGVGASKAGALILHGFAVLAAVFTGTLFTVILTGASLPLSLYALAPRRPDRSAIQAQGTTAVVTLGAVVLWPGYLLILVPLVSLSLYYHRRRFGIIHPGFPGPGRIS